MNLRPRYRPASGPPGPPLARDPGPADLARDAQDFHALSPAERAYLLRLVSLCQAGEEHPVLGLLPLTVTAADEETLESELRLTSTLWNGAKHSELFRQLAAGIGAGDLPRPAGLGYCRIVHEELPAALLRLKNDPSPAARAEASLAYDIVVLGIIVESACAALAGFLAARGIMPALRRGVTQLGNDTDRHLAASVRTLGRMVGEYGDDVKQAIVSRADVLRPGALAVLTEELADTPRVPGTDAPDELAARASLIFTSRLNRIASPPQAH